MPPSGLKFSKTHEWVRLDGQHAVIGISDFAVKELTDLVYIELPKIGTPVAVGKVFGEVESVKAVSDLYSPVAGEVIDANTRLADDLSLLSSDPYGDGWIAKIQLSDSSGIGQLMDQAQYEAFCAAGGH